MGEFAQDNGVTPLLFFWRTYIYICDPLCENPAKAIIFISLILTEYGHVNVWNESLKFEIMVEIKR